VPVRAIISLRRPSCSCN